MSLWVPPAVSRELLAERKRFAAGVREQSIEGAMMGVKSILDEATYRLRRDFNDDRLEVVRAAERVAVDSPMLAGYYAIVRWNEDAPPTVMNIQGEHGEFVDLDGNIEAAVAMMRRNDLSVRENRERLQRKREREEREAEEQKLRDRAERHEELRDRVNAAWRTSVSMNRDTPWTQNANGKRWVRKQKGSS